MNGRNLPVSAILAAGVGMGFAGDQLLRAPGGPGLNFFILFSGLAASVWIVGRTGGVALSREAWAWIGVGLLCGGALVGRGSGLLRFGTFLAACFAFALPALEAGRAWTRRSGVLDLLEALLGAGFHTVLGSARLLSGATRGGVGADTPRGAAVTVVRTALGGSLLALVPLGVFGALFLSADEVFAAIVSDFVQVDLQAFASHLVVTGLVSWLAVGYLLGVSSGTRLAGIRHLRSTHPTLGVAEVATALALVDLLFLGFVIVQFRYLFGGGGWVEVTPGLTYAAYARAGFFQLVVAVALAIPWLLLTHALVDARDGRARRVVAVLAGGHLALLTAIVASAIQRMLAYQTAYGLSEDRVVATAILFWLTTVVAWFGATVLTGRRDRFVSGALVTAFALVGALQVVNPAGWVTRHNLDHAESLGGVDVRYLTSLGSDAVPILVTRLGELSGEDQCLVATRLLSQWGPDRPGDWRTFNRSESRARAAVAEAAGTLRPISDAGPCR